MNSDGMFLVLSCVIINVVVLHKNGFYIYELRVRCKSIIFCVQIT